MPDLNREEINQRVAAINNALKEESPALVIAGFYALGQDLCNLFPDQGLDDILKEFRKKNINFYEAPLPNLEIVSYLISARENLAEKMDIDNLNDRNYFTAQLVGINAYLALIDTLEVAVGEESPVTKAFNGLGEVKSIHQRLANENVSLAEEILIAFKNSLGANMDFLDERVFKPITNLPVPEKIEGLKGVHLENLSSGRISPALLALLPEDLEQIKAKMAPLLALKEYGLAQVILAKEEGKVEARSKSREINALVSSVANSLAKYYSGDRDISAFINFTEEMNSEIESKKELIVAINAQHLIPSIKKIGVDDKSGQITDLLASLAELEAEADKIDIEHPDRAMIIDFISNTKKSLCNYFEGNKTPQAQNKLRSEVRNLVNEIEPVVDRHHSIKELFKGIGRKLRDLLTLGLYSYATTGHYGFYKTKAIRAVDHIRQQMDENNNDNEPAEQPEGGPGQPV